MIPDSPPTGISITPLIQGAEFSDWKSLNDTIMGGSSLAKCRFSEKGLFLEGNLVEEGGGAAAGRGGTSVGPRPPRRQHLRVHICDF